LKKTLEFLIQNSARIAKDNQLKASYNLDTNNSNTSIIQNKYTSASNAISVLNASKFNFHGKDFSNIYIPYANLNNANLSKVNL
jgi:hypothetical protein